MGYVVKVTKSFEKAFERYKNKKEELEKAIKKLEEYPDLYGKPLRGVLHGTWQLRVSSLRL